jgi:hypothetical protein
MSTTDASSALNPMFLRHDLILETGKLEEVIAAARNCPPADDARRRAALEAQYYVAAREALLRLLV